LSWIDLTISSDREVHQRRYTARTHTDAQGAYSVCGVPVSLELRVHASSGGLASGDIDLPPAGLRVQRRDLAIGPDDSTRAAARGSVVGSVRDLAGGPVGGARIHLDDTHETRSDPDGHFALRSVPIGTRQVEITTLGMAPVFRAVDVLPADSARLDVRVAKAVQLDRVNIAARPHATELKDRFESRLKAGWGRTVDSTTIARLPRVGDAFAQLAGARLTWSHDTPVVTVADGRGGQCAPDFWFDGARSDIRILTAVSPDEVAAIELYPHPESVPIDFQQGGMRYRCGALLVWTKWAFRDR
jgi:hypothetical protein